MQKRHCLPLLFLAFALVIPSAALACSCRPPESGQAALAKSAVAFLGSVKSIQFLDPRTQRKPEPRTIVTLIVKRVWKGDLGKTFVLHTQKNLWTCNGYGFEEGKEYLIFGKKQKEYTGADGKVLTDTFGVGICNGTRGVISPTDIPSDLGEGLVSTEGSPEE